jgi:hypothetical protein
VKLQTVIKVIKSNGKEKLVSIVILNLLMVLAKDLQTISKLLGLIKSNVISVFLLKPNYLWIVLMVIVKQMLLLTINEY